MKLVIQAQNGTLEFDNDGDVAIYNATILAKDVWQSTFIAQPLPLCPFDQIMAVHIVGKNTSATPDFSIQQRLSNNDVATTFTSETLLHYIANNLQAKQTGLVDINYLFKWNDMNALMVNCFANNTLQFRVLSTSNFTGYLHISVYVKKNSR